MTEITGYTMNEINELGLIKIFCDPNLVNDSINSIESEKEYEIISKNGSRKTIHVSTSLMTINSDESVSLVIDYTGNKGISLTFDTNVEEKILSCDPEKIERIILNLISNSVKFTEPGGNILVNLMDNGENITISVKDTGIGISNDKLNVIFDRFVQVDKSLARNREGSGIGLSLVKSLVEMHKGTIIVKSELNEGSEFIITLPCNLIDENINTVDSNSHVIQGNLEKTNIEFSDIYY